MSRFRFGTNVYKRGPDKEIDLAKRLRKATLQGGKVVGLQVDLGAKRRVPVRLVAIKKNPPAVTRKRWKDAKKPAGSSAY